MFGLIRAIQVGLIAGVIPIVFAEVAGTAHGAAIGFINTSRFAANAAGPMIATAVIAHASPFGLYLSVSAFTLLALALFLREHADAAAPLSPSEIALKNCLTAGGGCGNLPPLPNIGLACRDCRRTADAYMR